MLKAAIKGLNGKTCDGRIIVVEAALPPQHAHGRKSSSNQARKKNATRVRQVSPTLPPTSQEVERVRFVGNVSNEAKLRQASVEENGQAMLRKEDRPKVRSVEPRASQRNRSISRVRRSSYTWQGDEPTDWWREQP